MAYGIRIEYPPGGQAVSEWSELRGTFEVAPGVSVRPFMVDLARGLYWPQQPLTFDTAVGTWSARVHLGGPPGTQRTVLVATIGPLAAELCRHYDEVGQTTGKHEALTDLPADAVECDRVEVVKGSPSR